MPWSSFSECWALSQLFHSHLSLSHYTTIEAVLISGASSKLPHSSPGKTPDSCFRDQFSSAAAAKLLQSCPTLCDPGDGSPDPGILQARTLKCVAISFSNAGKWKVKVKSLSCVWLLSDPMDCSLPGSPVHGIFQARVLEWGAIALSQFSSR